MIKAKIKSMIANLAEKFIRFCVHKGCFTQDDVVNRLSMYVDVPTSWGNIKFFCPGAVPIWRANTFFEKEPETLEWIDSFSPGSTFFDVGANVGLYSLYAGIQKHKVIAIEPMSDNYFILQRNIILNKMDNVISYCIGLYDKNMIDTLKVRNLGFGQAENSFNEPVGSYDEKYNTLINQGSISFTLDYLSEALGVPNYIKIDVDGHELRVLEGGPKTLQHKDLKGILIELVDNTSSRDKVMELLSSYGFVLQKKENSSMIKNSKFENFYNNIFVRQN